jgi:hypothetical protein
MSQKVNITSPVGRIVMGSLYDPNTTDAEGKPLVVKTGPNAGQPRVNYFFALAIPKNPGETHWAQTAWGQQIWNVGNQAFPNIAQSPAFAWKIEDGDSQIPNKKGRKPCENEGWKNHWILKFSGGFAPKVYQQEGAGYVQAMQKDFVKPGYFVEVAFSVEGNGSQSQPGVYLNHSMVCFRAYGQEIQFGPDVSSAGFGAAPLPAGASMTPPAGAIPMPSAPAAVAPAVPAMPAPGAAPIPVTPNPAFVQVPPPVAAAAPVAMGVPNVPVVPPAAPATPVHQMTPAANGIAYEAYIAQGWTEAQLIQNGLMLA